MSTWFRGWKRWLLIYLALLACSHIWRAMEPDTVDLDPGEHSVTVKQVMGDSVLQGQPLRMVYRDVYQGNKQSPRTVLLLNGSPIGKTMFPTYIEQLSQKNRVIVPDFPGYEASSREIPDYSMRAMSLYMKQMLDSLNIDKVHVLGFSLGAGVAINMAHHYPEKVASIGMLSGLGVQELELLGSYYMNHAIYGGQLFFTWLLHEMVPHFGALNDFPIHVPYARSYYDSDQRPIRGYLKEYKKPMLIQHGRDDGLTPLAAAQEHHRLVPQSKLILYEGGHTIVEDSTRKLVADYNTFLRRVETGQALTSAEASRRRVLEAQKPFDQINFAKAKGFTLLILMLIIILTSFISEDFACIGAGLLVARGIIGFWPATAACFMGIIIGDYTVLMMGRWIGKPAIRRAPIKWFVSEKELESTAEWFNVRGPMIIIGSRFIPGSRFPIYFSAGMIGMSLLMFSFYFLLAGLVWTPALVGLSMLVGTELLRWFQIYQEYAPLVVPVIILLLYLFVKFVLPAVTWRGRRMVVSRWRRVKKWQYWPTGILSIPLALYIGYLGIKFRNMTAFTATNPGLSNGGFKDFSRASVLNSSTHQDTIASFITIEPELNDWEKFVKARDHIHNQQWEYPVVIKPDIADQQGAMIIPNEDELEKGLKNWVDEIILQKYIHGEEFTLFYYRYPEQQNGQILSITHKEFPTVTGDGTSTLEELILKNDTAVTQAKRYIQGNQDQIFEIPEEGREVQLVQVGIREKGAIISDVSQQITESLTSNIDQLARSIDGFYLGRLDIKIPPNKNLTGTECYKILEVNDITTYKEELYGFNTSYWEAFKKSAQLWKIAFEIGHQNIERGYKASSIIDLFQRMIHKNDTG